MPKIVAQSISILSDAGLGMAMFSLGESNLSPTSFYWLLYACKRVHLWLLDRVLGF